MKKILFILLMIFTCQSFAFGATYYVDDSAANDLGDGSSGSPKKYIGSGLALLSAGDTLIVKDGTYSNATDEIDSVPNGSAGNYITIKAENDGGAVISGLGEAITLSSNSYIRIEGFTIKNGTGAHSVEITGSNTIIIERVMIKNGAPYDNRYANVFEITEGSYDIAVQECAIVGSFRYGFTVYSGSSAAHDVVFRRCVARFDGNSEREPKAAFLVYGATDPIVAAYNVGFQNCIAIDCDGLDNMDGNGAFIGAFASPQYDSDGLKYMGCIALNIVPDSNTQGFYLERESSDTSANTLTNCVIWDINYQGLAARERDFAATNMTIGSSVNKGWDEWSAGTHTIADSLFVDNGATSSSGGVSSCYFDGESAVGSDSSTGDSGLSILWDSPIADGANIIYRYGTDDVFYGDAGWDTLTETALWPFPNEARIKTLFAEDDDISGNGTTRGFCAATENANTDTGYITLSSYITEYLGDTTQTAAMYDVSPAPLEITTTTLDEATQNTEYSDTVAATGGTEPYAFAVTSGTLPTGLNLTEATGEISGTPTGTGASEFTVTVTDAAEDTDDQALSITVNAAESSLPLTIPGCVLSGGKLN